MRILFVDDEEDLLDLAQGIFADEGLPLMTARGPQDALGLTRQHDFDVIITDAHMPQGSGLDLCRTLRKNSSFKGKLILVSGELERPGWKEGSGYDVALTKPLNFNELIEHIRSSQLSSRTIGQ